jgi:hypothetical protein
MHILDPVLDIRLAHINLNSNLTESILQLVPVVTSNHASNQGGWQGELHYRRREEHQWIAPLMQTIEATVKTYKPNARLYRIWFNVNGTGHSNRWHKHSRDELVTVTYVKTNPKSGAIEFRHDDYTYAYTPNIDEILVFSGAIEHRVLENISDESRISIACNFKMV